MSDIPPDIAEALQRAGLTGFFADYSPVHQNEYLKWITAAKRPETRKARIEKTIQMLAEKKGGAKTRTQQKRG